jgi:hypothetical protein
VAHQQLVGDIRLPWANHFHAHIQQGGWQKDGYPEFLFWFKSKIDKNNKSQQ